MGVFQGAARNFDQHQHHPFERVRVDYVETPRECVRVMLKHRGVPLMSGQGVCGWPKSAGMSWVPSCGEEPLTLVFFLDLGFLGDDFLLADF